MRTCGAVAAILLPAILLRSAQVAGQAGPTLEPRLSFDVASVKLNKTNARTQHIDARADHQPDSEERPAYYRGLLADRFHVAAHVKKRDMDVYTLALTRTDGDRFDIDLGAAPLNAGPRAGEAFADLPTVFTAVQEQLGLRVQSGRAPIDVLVIDRIEMPAED